MNDLVMHCNHTRVFLFSLMY